MGRQVVLACAGAALLVAKAVQPANVFSADPALGQGSGLAGAPAETTVAAARALGIEPLVLPAEFFPILTWDKLRGWKPPYRDPTSSLPGIAECNFTIAGFVNAEDLPLCEKLGLLAIVPPEDNAPATGGRWAKLSDEEIDRKVKAMVEKGGASKAVLGYFIVDEPGAGTFPTLAKVVAAVKRHAPGKLAYINLYPSYATVGAPDKSQLGTATYTEYLERFVTEVKPQLLSYDNYMVQYSDDLQGAKAALYYADLLEVRRVGLKYGLPFWNVVSGNQIRKYTTIPSPANLAFQAYTTLASGGRGISWFKYYQDAYRYAAVDNSGGKTLTWRYLQAVNRQVRTLGPIMNRLRSTGVFFSSPPPVPSLPQLPGKVIRRVQAKASPRGLGPHQPPVMVGEFAGPDGADYVMIVNLSLERSANVKLETVKPCKSKLVFSAEDARLAPLDEENGLWLLAGHGALVKLQ